MDRLAVVQDAAWYRALSLVERQHPLPDEAKDLGEARLRLREWKEQKTFHQEPLFAERLAMDGMTEELLLRLLGESEQQLQLRLDTVPGWMVKLSEALKESTQATTFHIPTQEQTAYTTLFLEAAGPLIQHGLKHVRDGLQVLMQQYTSLPFVEETIVQSWLTNLIPLLSPQLRTLILEMHVARIQGKLQGETSQERFIEFMCYIGRPEQLSTLFAEYPVLARILITTIEQWGDYLIEFLQHLCTDWETICTTLTPDKHPGLLQTLQAGAGDSHRKGRSVLLLQFESGFRLIYKPKSLAVDVHFQELLRWLNERGTVPTLRTLTMLDRGSYGWSEYVQPISCTSSEQVKRFYLRLGSYLALLYVINGADFHSENIIASGEHPMLVDLEALFHPDLGRGHLQEEDVQLERVLQLQTVLQVGLLPARIWSPKYQSSIDITGLGGKAGQYTPWPVAQWQEVGTDAMHLVRQPAQMFTGPNRPRLHDREVDPLDYRDCLLEGFQQMYCLLMQYRAQLLSGPLQRFAADEIRVIVRHTRTYEALLRESFHPDWLRDGLKRDSFFDHLWDHVPEYSYLAPLIPVEVRSLWRGDIPMFLTSPQSRALMDEEHVCLQKEFFAESGLETACKRLQSLTQDDLQQQSWLIQASFTSMVVQDEHMVLPETQEQSTTELLVTRPRLWREALMIGQRIKALALRGDSSTLNWPEIIMNEGGGWNLQMADESLYQGTAGITLFLAYLGTIVDDNEMTALAQEGLAATLRQVEQKKRAAWRIGAFDGLGSIIYLLTHLGTLWNQSTLLADAEALVTQHFHLISEDEQLDIASGAAGYMLSLLSLYDITPSVQVLQAAMRCGDHLIATAQRMEQGSGWRIPSHATPLTGFAHGAAGIALGLLKLAHRSGEERYWTAAHAALAYERSLFSQEMHNWPDLRDIQKNHPLTHKSESTLFKLAWCHGAPGIGLSRLAALPYLDTPEMREEIANALQSTLAMGSSSNHTLCHGHCGNLELLLSASQILQDKPLKEQVERWSTRLLVDRERHGWIGDAPFQVETPGLMTGLAGIGYELLRLADPQRVPSLLVLEPPYREMEK
jgi:type 2 lantibiotic biosynthesis protein LanM